MASTGENGGENGRAASCAGEISDRRLQKRSRALPRRRVAPILDGWCTPRYTVLTSHMHP